MKLRAITSLVTTIRPFSPSAAASSIIGALPSPAAAFVNAIASQQSLIALGTPVQVRRQLFAQLGDIRFEVLGAMTGLETRKSYSYAKHAVIEGKPQLQATGDELDEVTLVLRLLDAIADPATTYADLCAAAAQHLALPFVFASGQVMGRYVITNIEDGVKETDEGGRVTQRDTRVTLLEWVEAAPLEVASRARRAAASSNVAAASKVTPAVPAPAADFTAVPVNTILRRP